ncbi:MAG: lytic transglycosylase domain-containing protein [Proteobacteria bacterium]|nr:lytic transglycosylase domain-containing protein [Pseudomonadota bacterium]MBU1965661.1 lytic transglycosylase domain-containing protein [Pseudomonadota bacterium]MBU4371555.1 lytic transglycosylase domain-containing protein [Pseudomonadota bacterium]MBU4583055.1 lytic transglycosylase domain-containing protein [Pseudomonadota bacterium]MCG2739628.1 lytic transglycosylase domain-containing protein [Syntrophaceae bacterium]
MLSTVHSRKIICPKNILLLLVMNLLFFTAPACHGDIYKYTDSEGVIHLTNIPTEHGVPYVLVIREKRVIFQLKRDVAGYDDLIAKASSKYRVDSSLVKAVIKAESNFNHRAVSPVGAQGLMQLMPATAASLQVRDAFHPETNIDGGVRYLRYLMNLFNGNLPLVLAAYNAGENAVLRHNNRIPPYRETQTYVKRVLNLFDKYSRNGTP